MAFVDPDEVKVTAPQSSGEGFVDPTEASAPTRAGSKC